MKNKNIYIGILMGLLSLMFIRCEDNIDPLVTEVEFGRVFAPVGLDARIRNMTTIELNWEHRDDAAQYVVEFSEDSLAFSNIIRTINVQPDDLPVQETFEGATRYSARVKGVSAEEGVADSKWVAVTIMTDPENILLPIQDGDIDATVATIRWPANSEVTHFIITPGNVERAITPDEAAAGMATITGLTGETDYTVVLWKGQKQRGSVSFRTLVDIGDATPVHPEDDLSAVIAAAAPGDALVLFPGDYLVYTGSITLDKSIAIKGLRPFDKPKLHVQFTLTDGVSEVELRDLDLSGDETLSDVFRFSTEGVEYGSLTVVGCDIHDFSRSLVGGNVASTVESFSIDNSVVTDVLTGGGDFIDFRNTHIGSVSVTNSTFNNCAPGRDFVRIDAASGYSGTGLSTNVLIDHCTLYGVSNTQDRILYVRFDENTLTVQNTLIAATDGYFTNQGSSSQPTCTNNNYYNATGFYTAGYVSNAKIDESGNHTTLDPGFADAVNGDFTVSNQTIKDNNVGDPRWLQ